MSAKIGWSIIRAIYFDVYGTLISWETGINNTAKATALGSYVLANRARFIQEVVRYDSDIQEDAPAIPQSEVVAKALGRRTKEVNVVHDGQVNQEIVDEVYTQYGNSIRTFDAFEDTVEAM